MKLNRFLAALLAAALVLTLLPAALAASSSFSDVTDADTAVNADVLRLMGVVKGDGTNRYDPEGVLTRAQFSAMAIRAMGREDEAARYTTRTIFSDVGSAHWGRGYVNLAASIAVDSAGTRLLLGVGDGRFLPDEPITYPQAVTILCRMLGYGDDVAGAAWPSGYLNQATVLGLLDGTEATGGALTRAQAAQLFVRLFSAKTSSGVRFYESLGSVQETVILLAVNATADDGSAGALRTTAGVYLPAVDGVAPTALVGRRGALVLNSRGKVAAFLPDDSAGVTITLAEAAALSSLRGTNGVRYTLDRATPVYLGSQSDSVAYRDAYLDLTAGTQVTLFLDGGKVSALYWAGSADAATQAMVVTAKLNSASFYQLTGGAAGYTLQKRGQTISADQVQLYDVATYDPGTNTVVLSDLRLTAVYEDASPSPAAPTEITVLGHTFEVLPSALDTIATFKTGQTVSLLLTADGKVAGMAAVTAQTASTAVGLAGADGVDVGLPNGKSIQLSGTVPASLQGKLVTVSAAKGGKLTAASLSLRAVSGDFNVQAMTLGSDQAAPGVRLYEETGGALTPLSLSDLELDTVPQAKLSSCHRDGSGLVDILVLQAVTGNSYTYGALKKGTAEYSVGELTAANATVEVVNGGSGLAPAISARSFREGDFGGVALSSREINGVPVAADLVMLTAVSGVSRTAFFQKDGRWYVNAQGGVYRVADQVEGYLPATGKWLPTGDLTAIRAYSNDLTLYLDPIASQVRIIAAN